MIKNSPLLDDWRYYMKDVVAPDSFINMGFYYTILASLQRRIWTGSEQMALFPNEYIILVGPPACGKTQVIKQVASLLKHHKLPNKKQVMDDPTFPKRNGDVAEMVALTAQEQQVKVQEEYYNQKLLLAPTNNQMQEPEYLLPIAADATTYESLVQAMAHTTRRIQYEHRNEDGSTSKRNYVHKSLNFCLEEISSLFAKNADKIVQFLLVAFDCGDYDYKTKHQGEDRLRKTCLNFLGGTTPSFLQSSFDDRLIGDGFTSRTIFIYETTPRFVRFGPIELCKDQLAARMNVLSHIKELSTLYGQIKFSPTQTPEAWKVLKTYFEEVLPKRRPNASPKLEPYYGRKSIHAIKMAMAIHFSKSTTLTIDPQDCVDALEILEDVEQRMHHALNFGKNPIAPLMRNILMWLKELPEPQVRVTEITKQFMNDNREMEIQEALRVLCTADKIVPLVNKKSQEVFYALKTRLPKEQVPTSLG